MREMYATYFRNLSQSLCDTLYSLHSLWENVITGWRWMMMMGMAQIVLLLHPHGLTMWLVDDVWKGLPAQQCEARANNIIIDKRRRWSTVPTYQWCTEWSLQQALTLMGVDGIITEPEEGIQRGCASAWSPIKFHITDSLLCNATILFTQTLKRWVGDDLVTDWSIHDLRLWKITPFHQHLQKLWPRFRFCSVYRTNCRR